jgi:ribosomal protein L16 Arg81 hydroxylase
MQQSKDIEEQYPRPEQPYMDFILDPGDIFYLPRGWWHNPLPLGEATFHLAIGTFPAYAIYYAQWAFQQLPNLVEARRSMCTWEQDRETVASLGSHLDKLLNDPANYSRFMDEFIGATRVESSLAIDLFGAPHGALIPDDTRLRLNANKIHGIDDGYIIANGTRLSLDETGTRLIRCVADHPAIRLADLIAWLHDIDAEKTRRLAHSLCHQDILEPLRR